MVILLNEHSIFWSFLYACLVWCVANADSHQNIANFRLGKRKFWKINNLSKNSNKSVIKIFIYSKKEIFAIFENSIVFSENFKLKKKFEIHNCEFEEQVSINKSKLVYIAWRLGNKTDTHVTLDTGITPTANTQLLRWFAEFGGQSNSSNSARESKARSYLEQRYIVVQYTREPILEHGIVIHVYLC